MTTRFAAIALAIAGLSCGGSEAKTPGPIPPASTPTPAGTPSPAARVVDDLANLRFDELGNPVIRWDAIPAVQAPKDRPHQLLVVLVEFSDLGFERFRGQKAQGSQLASWYQERLFDDDYQQKNTLSHYYATQSRGQFHVTGRVLPPVTLSKKRAAYGRVNRPKGGTWRNDVDPDTMVEESLRLAARANPDFPWADFDRWDPADYDDDGIVDEPDGYLDHFVLVFAGGGQSSCQLLNNIGDVLTPNVGNEAIERLDEKQLECADRLWPHRDAMRRREGTGPKIGSVVNPRGGVPLTDDLWAYDYNMQSEYTESATFIHEFGHSIGLPDVYSRTSSNSTGGWEVMSSTADPSPQNLSAWSRLQLGWLKPRVVRPPDFGGQPRGGFDLGLVDDPDSKADDAIMVILPPKQKRIELTTLPESSGKLAMYSGQGNEMNRKATVALDLSSASRTAKISMDAWWEIEGGWDFAYVEASADGGKSWRRLLPEDARHMPAKHGHDGKTTRPGFTGLSGDLDGDGKNESHPECDPKEEIKHGEDKAGSEKSKCLSPTWVEPSFSLADYLGKKDVRFRIRYYTDAAAVMRGFLFDNVVVEVDGKVHSRATFEDDGHGWAMTGFSPSPGRHDLLVPHYYLVEYRDPYEDPAYDGALADPSYGFYYDSKGGRMVAVASRPRPGALVWYFNGAYAWSENDPAINGPGKGYLLPYDGNPNEIALPGFSQFLKGSAESNDSHYQLGGKDAQELLRKSYLRTVCFVRGRGFMPRGGLPGGGKCKRQRGKGAKAPVKAIEIDGKTAIYSYELINSYLPGTREGFKKVSELVDVKRSKKKGLSYRLRDRGLRYLHTLDAPLALEPFERGRVLYEVKGDQLIEIDSRSHPAVRSTSDIDPSINPKLPFGGVERPADDVTISVSTPDKGAPAGTRIRVEYAYE